MEQLLKNIQNKLDKLVQIGAMDVEDAVDVLTELDNGLKSAVETAEAKAVAASTW